MDPNSTDFCPNCGIIIPRSVDHRCPSYEDGNKQFDGDKESTTVVDNTVKESKFHEETPSELARRRSFSSSDIEKFQESTFKKSEYEYKLENLRLLKKDPLISEGSTMSPTNEEGFTEESQEDVLEANRISAENQEDASGFLSIDTSLYSCTPDYTVSQFGNPLDSLPFEQLILDESSDSNQSKDKNAVARRQSISHNATTAKNLPSSGVTISKRDCSGTFLSFSGIPEHQSTSEGASFALPSDNQASPSKLNRRRHSRSKSKTSPLKQSTRKSHRYGKSTISCSTQKSDAGQKSLPDQKFASETTSSTLASDRQVCSSTPEHMEHVRADLKTSLSKHSPKKSYRYGKSTMTCSAQKSDGTLMALQDPQYGSEKGSSTLPSGSPSGTSGPDHRRRSRTTPKKSSEKPFLCDECGKRYDKRYFKIHIKLHSNEKPCVCKECGKAFAINKYLHVHSRQHTGERKLICDVCGRTFVNQSNCCNHRRRHTK